ncbi:hypothetical protein ACOMHN_056677 [Nucella lapillus]
MSKDNKRLASSPLLEETAGKRACADDNSFFECDSDSTIIDSNYLSSTRLESPPAIMSHTDQPSGSIREEVRAALVDPVVLELMSKAVAAQVTSQLREEIKSLREQLAAKDVAIKTLQDQVDAMEQYGRCNNVRISPIPETDSENTDTLVQTVAKAVGVDIPDHAIDRSHRVGRQETDRAVLVKFTSYKYKQAFLKARSGLSEVDGKKLFPALDWPTAPVSGSQRSAGPSARRLYVNEDLTRIRADVARRARALKKAGKISDTWCRDGITFVKKGGEVLKLTRLSQIEVLG